MQFEESSLNHWDNYVLLGEGERYHPDQDAIYRLINEFSPTMFLGMLVGFILFSFTPALISVYMANYHPALRMDYLLSGIESDFVPGIFDTSLLPFGWSVSLCCGSIAVAVHVFFTRLD